MIWKNPFQIKNFEQNDSEITYLDLFNAAALNIIDENMFKNSTYITSTPGAGKTSLFKAFSASILQIISNEQYSEKYSHIVDFMKNKNIIVDGKVKLLTCHISCARNYDILEEIFTNGRRRQIFYALINFRIIIAFIRNICTLMDTVVEEGAKLISFEKIPDELISESEFFLDGEILFKWACDSERNLCKYLDSNRDKEISISFIYTTLLIIKLFEPNNILINGKKSFNKCLIIFDDMHKLAESQKKYLVEEIYIIRPQIGVWFGERVEGLSTSQIISMDGSFEREYNPRVFIDEYWHNNNRKFATMLKDVANRRVKKANLSGLEDFTSCISDEREVKEYEKQSIKGINSIKKEVAKSSYALQKYSKVIEHIETEDIPSLKRGILFECLNIKFRREQYGQMSFYLDEVESIDLFEEFVSDVYSSAEYYFCIKNNIPYYFGENRVICIASGNIEQFLYIAAGIFERSRTAYLGSKRSRNRYRLTASEQEKYIKEAVGKMWNEMLYRYEDAKEIQIFLDNICEIGRSTRNTGRNSYAGGAVTGIGIRKETVLDMKDKPKYNKLMDILSKCIASKYLERKIVNRDGENYVFYLNRWICVHYGLPLAYGGFRQISIDTAVRLCNNLDINEKKQTNVFEE